MDNHISANPSFAEQLSILEDQILKQGTYIQFLKQKNAPCPQIVEAVTLLISLKKQTYCLLSKMK